MLSLSFVIPLISVITAALAISEGKETKQRQQRKLLPAGRQPTSQEESAAPHVLRQIPGTHTPSQGLFCLFNLGRH